MALLYGISLDTEPRVLPNSSLMTAESALNLGPEASPSGRGELARSGKKGEGVYP